MSETTDLFIIGGGINGCGIARDAVGRGLTVRLAEMGDLAQATSSKSTKLFHGGLGRVDKMGSHEALSVIQAGICDGGQLGTRPYVGRGMGVL